MAVETGSFYHLPDFRPLVTPLAEIFEKHPCEATTAVAAVFGIALGLMAKPLLLPALDNAIKQLSLALQH